MLSKSASATGVPTGVASNLTAGIPVEDHHVTVFCTMLKLYFLHPEKVEGIWRLSAEASAESQVFRHILQLKSTLKSQPKLLAKGHPRRLWQ